MLRPSGTDCPILSAQRTRGAVVKFSQLHARDVMVLQQHAQCQMNISPSLQVPVSIEDDMTTLLPVSCACRGQNFFTC